jgi:hypothetical protein
VNSIRDELVALDTNEIVFALRRHPDFPACQILLFDRLDELNVYMPLQVLLELQRNLHADELAMVFLALTRARSVSWDYTPASPETVREWEERGAREGDAVIAAHLGIRSIRYLLSENRHFLAELMNLPFQVLSGERALQLLG